MNGQPRPNLFAYATKELSQDAMICWLIEWSATAANDAGEQALRNLGRTFVDALFGKHNVTLAGDVQRVEICQQDRGIDVLVRIRDESSERVLLIEDKTGTEVHGDQLQRYCEAVSNGQTGLGEVSDHRPVYLKTGNQSLASDRKVENTGFKVFRRDDFLAVLDGYRDAHPIVTDFREHLQGLEDDFKSFRDWRRQDERETWSWAGWEGFYRRLECELETDDRHVLDWGYVPNQSGGFLGFSWIPFDTGSETIFYLLLEIAPWNPARQKLCFKVAPAEEDAHMRARDFHELLCKTDSENLITRPDKFGYGTNMTVGWWREEWLAFGADGRLDFGKIAENLRQARQIVEAARDLHQRENA